MLSLTAACLAPFWTMSQKVSPSPEWVTIAKVQRGVSTAARPSAAAVPARSSARLPPVLLHPASTRQASAGSRASAAVRARVLVVPVPSAAVGLGRLSAYGRVTTCGPWWELLRLPSGRGWGAGALRGTPYRQGRAVRDGRAR